MKVKKNDQDIKDVEMLKYELSAIIGVVTSEVTHNILIH